MPDFFPPTHTGPVTQAVTPRGWDFLGTVPVPLRQMVFDGLTRRLTCHRLEGGKPLAVCFPMGQGGPTPFERLRRIRRWDDYPAMVMSADEGNLFNRRFYAEHGDAFRTEQPGPVAEVFAGLVDPLGQVGVFAVAPFVLLIDHRRLGGLPVPRSWGDLLDPRYRGQVVFSGWKRAGAGRCRHFNSLLLLAIQRMFGDDGIAALAANVPALVHSAQMPRIAGSNASVGGIYVLPWSLADLCPRRAHTSVVWPEEGALAYPLWTVVKETRRDDLAPLRHYVFGTELAGLLNRNRYPALAPGMAPILPPGARLWWPGWDVVRDRATADTRRRAADGFFTRWRPADRQEGTARCA